MVDHQLQHTRRRQQNASAPQILNQQDGKLARLSVGLGYGRELGREVAGLCSTEALEAAAAHQLGQLMRRVWERSEPVPRTVVSIPSWRAKKVAMEVVASPGAPVLGRVA